MSTAVIGNLKNHLTTQVFSSGNFSMVGWTGIGVQSGSILVLAINPYTNVYLAMSNKNSYSYNNAIGHSVVINVPIPVGTTLSSITIRLLPIGNEIFENVEPFELTNNSVTFTYVELFILFVIIILIMYYRMNK